MMFKANLTIQGNLQPDSQVGAPPHLDPHFLYHFLEVFHPHIVITRIHILHSESIC